MRNDRREMAADLLAARQRFDAWRADRVRGAKIPDELWALAVDLAGRYGLGRAVTALRLDYYGLMLATGTSRARCNGHDEQAVETLPRCPACQKTPMRWLGYVPGHRTTRRFTRLRPFVPETLAESLLLKSMIAHSVYPSNAVARPP